MNIERKKIFLSYSSLDTDLVEQIKDYLTAEGYPCWYAPDSVRQNYNEEIADAIEHEVEAVIVFITENVGESKIVPKEVILASNYNKPLIPIFVREVRLPKTLELHLCNEQGILMDAEELTTDFLEELFNKMEEVYSRHLSGINRNKDLKRPVLIKGSATSVLFEVQETIKEKVESVFVKPDDFEQYCRRLKENRILVIYNREHVGKYTAALSIFQSLNVKSVFEWSKTVSFADINKHPLPPNGPSGLIAEIETVEEFFSGIREYEFEQYLEKLKVNDVYFIILSRGDAHVLIEPYSLYLKSHSNTGELIRKHIDYLVNEQELRMKLLNWLETEDGKTLLSMTLAPREVQPLLSQMERVIKGDITSEQLFSTLGENARERTKAWFMSEKRSINDIAFFLTISVYEGNTYLVAIEKSRKLYNFITEVIHDQQYSENESIARDQYLSRFNADIKWRRKNYETGLEEIEAIYLSFPEEVFTVWEYIWNQHPEYIEALVKWLEEIILEKDTQAKNRVVKIITHLFKMESVSVRSTIFIPWAKSKNVKLRMYAVNLLNELAKDEDYTHFVFKMVKAWSSTTNYNLQWTATLLLGMEISQFYYSQSLTLLRRIHERNSEKLGFSIQNSLMRISDNVFLNSKFDELYFRFWEQWLTDNSALNIEATIFAHSVFAKKAELLFGADSKWDEQFWTPFISTSLTNYKTRKTAFGLLDTLIYYTDNNESYINRMACLIFNVYDISGHIEREHLRRFVERGASSTIKTDNRIKRRISVYKPIQNILLGI